MSAWCLGMLNSHGKFFLSYVAPVLMNVAMIAALFIFGGKISDSSLALAAAWGTVVGAALQFGIQVPFVFRYSKQIHFGLQTAMPQVREVIRNFGPVVLGRGVVQLSAYLDNLLASLLGTAAVSALAYAQIIYLLPISLFGMSVAAAELPQMSRVTGTEEEVYTNMRKRLERGLRQIAFFVIPSVVAFIAIGDRLVAALFQGGRFHHDDTLYVWYILIGSTVGLLAATLGRLYSSAFYALRDTKTPLKFAGARVILTGVLGYLCALPLRPLFVNLLVMAHVPLPNLPGGTLLFGVVGLTASAGVAGWLEYILLRRALQRRIGPIVFPISFQLKLWSSAIAAGALAVLCERFTSRAATHLPFRYISEGILVAGIFGAVYFIAAAAFGVPEVRATLSRVTRR